MTSLKAFGPSRATSRTNSVDLGRSRKEVDTDFIIVWSAELVEYSSPRYLWSLIERPASTISFSSIVRVALAALNHQPIVPAAFVVLFSTNFVGGHRRGGNNFPCDPPTCLTRVVNEANPAHQWPTLSSFRWRWKRRNFVPRWVPRRAPRRAPRREQWLSVLDTCAWTVANCIK